MLITVLPRFHVHALIYVAEALVHAPKASPNSHFFGDEKCRPATYISACHCRETSNFTLDMAYYTFVFYVLDVGM